LGTTASKRGQFWRADWFVGVLVVLCVIVLNKATNFVDTLENRFYDYGITQSDKKPSDQIAIVAIDDQSVANLGRWPWSRDVQAKLIDQISAGKPKAIINQILYPEPQIEKGLPFLTKIRESISVEEASGNPKLEAISKIAAEAEVALNADARLAQAFTAAGNVVGMVSLLPGDARGKADKALNPATLRSLVKAPIGYGMQAAGILEPLDVLASKVNLVGHGNKAADIDGTLRVEPLLADYYGQSIPSISLVAALKGLNLAPSDIQVFAAEDVIQIGKLRIGINELAQMRPFYYADKEGSRPFAQDSAFDVMSGKISASKYADKVVFLGPSAAGVVGEFPTPLGGRGMTALEQSAHITSGILSEHFVTTPLWVSVLSAVVVLLVATYLIFLLPRLSAGNSAIVTALIFAALLISSYVLLSRYSKWVQLVFPAVLLLIGHLALTTKRFLVTEAGKLKSDEESAETNRMMGLALQGQGQLDMAFDRFRRVPVGDALMGNLGSLALDFERKRQFNKSQAVYEYMAGLDKGYKGLDAKLNRAKNLSETVILGGNSTHPGGTVLLAGGGVEKPMLGRYQVDKELGKGAMGVVYLGKDPKIGRVVAIKTMALSQEFDGDELVDARERFFREAETAGRLQHQNIVTIFDAGEEHDLAYIAMEFLKGKDLMDYCKPGALLPVPVVLSIVERVAQALAYAHKQSVVHRDIKPANIMYEIDSDTVKVTDFGIARITDSSKTKTGIVLGTPSFMSPEQIAGKKVDGRSDLYSLGVMLFQMLTGVLPFRGDSMAELMYKIANEEAPDVRSIRADLSEQTAHVVALSLSKRPETRFQDGGQFAADLRLAIAALGTASEPANLAVGAPASAQNSSATQLPVSPYADRTAVLMASLANDETLVLPPRGDEADGPSFAATRKIDANSTNFDKTVVSKPPVSGYKSEN
jgi:eukaryotic-like serine/threonine-protein kinase